MNYRCIYEIDVEADTPEEAAREAFSCMVDPASMLPIIAVTPWSGAGPPWQDPVASQAVGKFAASLLCYVEDGNVVELRACGFVQELRSAVEAAKPIVFVNIDLNAEGLEPDPQQEGD